MHLSAERHIESVYAFKVHLTMFYVELLANNKNHLILPFWCRKHYETFDQKSKSRSAPPDDPPLRTNLVPA